MKISTAIFPLAVIVIVIGGILHSVPLTEQPVIIESKKETTVHEEIMSSTISEVIYTKSSAVEQTSKRIEFTSKKIRTTEIIIKTRTDSRTYCRKYTEGFRFVCDDVECWEVIVTKCIEYGYKKIYRTFTITEGHNTYVTSPKTTIFQEYIIITPFQETSTQWKQITLTQTTPTMLTIPTTVYQKTTIENAQGIAISLWIIGILIFISGLLLRSKIVS